MIKRVLTFLLLASVALAYDPPPGIPDPADSTVGGLTPFGYEIDIATPAFPASWIGGSQSETQGYYYIDQGHIAATNTSNTYGYPDKPRLTPPTHGASITQKVGGGVFMYFGGGGHYKVAHLGAATLTWYGVGTSANPFWIVGDPLDPPTFSVAIGFTAADTSFWHLRNLNFQHNDDGGTDRWAYIEMRPTATGVTVDHVIIQDCTFTGQFEYFSIGGIAAGGSSADQGTVDFNVESVVVQNCTVHQNGNPALDNSEQGGIGKAQRSKGMWVLDSTVYGVGSDSIFGSHFGDDDEKKTHYYFIGGNTLYDPDPDIVTISAAADASGDTNFTVNDSSLFPSENAVATYTVSGTVINSVTIVDGGAGYRPGYIYVQPDSGIPFGAGGGAVIEATVNGSGTITALTIITGGGGYTAGNLDIYTNAFISESSVDGYKGFQKVLSVPDSTHIICEVAYTATATGTIEVGEYNGENSIDIKSTRYGVISQNLIKGPYAREQGWGLVLHQGENSVAVRDFDVCFNTIHHVPCGIAMTNDPGCQDINMFGNVIYDLRVNYGESRARDTFFARGIAPYSLNGTTRIVDNTFYDYETAIGSSGTAGTLLVHGNIFAGRVGSGYDIYCTNGLEDTFATDYNLFSSSPRIFYNNALRTTLAYMQGEGEETNSDTTADFLFVNAATGNFRPQEMSPAVGMSVEGPVGDTVYDDFNTLWGYTAQYDSAGNARPAGGSWDAGAFEFVAGSSPEVAITVPASPPTVTVGTPITFTATATDAEDGDIAENVVWTSSIDGALGTDNSISPTLTAGTHTITATITDSDDNVDFAEIIATVNAAEGEGNTITATTVNATTVNVAP